MPLDIAVFTENSLVSFSNVKGVSRGWRFFEIHTYCCESKWCYMYSVIAILRHSPKSFSKSGYHLYKAIICKILWETFLLTNKKYLERISFFTKFNDIGTRSAFRPVEQNYVDVWAIIIFAIIRLRMRSHFNITEWFEFEFWPVLICHFEEIYSCFIFLVNFINNIFSGVIEIFIKIRGC